METNNLYLKGDNVMNGFTETDLYKVANKAIEKAALNPDKDAMRLAADYARIVADHEKNLVEAEKAQKESEAEQNRLEQEKKIADRQHRMEIIKLTCFVGVTVAGVAIENKYMVSSWFSKTFLQKTAPRV